MRLMKNSDQDGFRVKSSGETHTILGADAEFNGKLIYKGSVRIEGHFQGEIVTNDVLVIGESAHVEANLNVGTLVVHGVFTGTVDAKDLVELRRPCQFFGSIYSPSLVIEQGVIFEGNCKMGNKKAQPANDIANLNSNRAIDHDAPVEVYDSMREEVMG